VTGLTEAEAKIAAEYGRDSMESDRLSDEVDVARKEAGILARQAKSTKDPEKKKIDEDRARVARNKLNRLNKQWAKAREVSQASYFRLKAATTSELLSKIQREQTSIDARTRKTSKITFLR
jgi:hypothetical protein